MNEPGSITLAYMAAHPQDAARAMETLDPVDLAAFIATTPVRLAAPSLAAVAPWRAARCLVELPPDRAAALLEEMPAERRTPSVRAMPETAREAVLAQMPQDRARALRRQLGYPAALAGSVMASDMVSVRTDATVADALEAARAFADRDVIQVYLVDTSGRPDGVVPLASLLNATPERPIRELARRDCDAVMADTPLSHVETDRNWSQYPERPVVDSRRRLVGSVTLARILEARDRPAGTMSTGPGPMTLLAQGYLVSIGGLTRLVGNLLLGTTESRDDR